MGEPPDQHAVSADALAALRRRQQVQVASERDQTSADLDQTGGDADQTAADADQAGSDTDQQLSERDQDAADLDQAASDEDQAASDEDQASSHAAGPEAARDRSRDERAAARQVRDATTAGRARTTADRFATASQRDQVAGIRDLTADARDRNARAREDAAIARDRAADARERLAAAGGGERPDVTKEFRVLRRAAAAVRRQASQERASAASDRRAAAADREAAAADRAIASLDELTGLFRRGAGELALANELARSRRSGRPAVLALVDLDGLKATNDQRGHAAGDVLLRDVAMAITAAMRAYDVAVRWGGDEFVCALSDMTLEVAAERVATIRRELQERGSDASVSVGLAQTDGHDALEVVVQRADAAMYHEKAARSDP